MKYPFSTDVAASMWSSLSSTGSLPLGLCCRIPPSTCLVRVIIGAACVSCLELIELARQFDFLV